MLDEFQELLDESDPIQRAIDIADETGKIQKINYDDADTGRKFPVKVVPMFMISVKSLRLLCKDSKDARLRRSYLKSTRKFDDDHTVHTPRQGLVKLCGREDLEEYIMELEENEETS